MWQGLSAQRLCEITHEVDLYNAAAIEWANALAVTDPSLTRLRRSRVAADAVVAAGDSAAGDVAAVDNMGVACGDDAGDAVGVDPFDIDPSTLEREEMASVIDELTTVAARLRHAAERVEMTMSGIVAATGLNLSDCVPSPRQWVAREHGLSGVDAGRLLRADRARRRHPLLDPATRAGLLTVAHLDAIEGIIPARLRGAELAAAIDAVNEIVDNLLASAAELTIDEFRRLCVRARSMLDTDGDEPRPDSPAAPSKVYLSELFNGRWSLVGDLSADDGALLASILDDHLARASRARDEARPDGMGADEAGADEAGAGEAGAQAHEPAREPHSVRLAQVLQRLVFDGAGANTPGRASIFLHIDLESLRRPRAGLPGDLLLGDGARAKTEARLDISEDTLWGLLSGADVTPVFSRSGSPLCFGRTRRAAAPIQRRVLAHRYGGCATPGCTATANWTQGHHLLEWERGGPTDIDNLRPKCTPHHLGDHAAGVESTAAPPRLPSFLRRLTVSYVAKTYEAAGSEKVAARSGS